ACVGCPIAPFHGVRDACAQYGLDEAAFRAELRAAVAGRPPAPARALRPRPRPRPQQGES
ncbi:MAG TPA: hypothetical protein VFN28_14300, partial [Amaricoccus sp.]|nr:hypothetical protein [Amaricoccus sp.]